MTAGTLPSREQALALLHEWIANPALRKHCYIVEAAMRAYAEQHGEQFRKRAGPRQARALLLPNRAVPLDRPPNGPG